MGTHHQTPRTCAVCNKTLHPREALAGGTVRPAVSHLIAQSVPSWSADSFICPADLARFRADYVRSMLESEKGELSQLDTEVLESLKQQELLASNVDATFDSRATFGERLADRIADFGGSWTFMILFGGFLTAWIVMNSLVVFWRPIDPYPFILLNLVLSSLAAVQAPVIMMSQNRQETKDRVRAQHDYQVNLKAELEIRHLHEKMDHLLSHQWERLVEIQQVQLELLTELGNRR